MQLIEAWDKPTGQKLEVPESWFALFPNLSRTDPAEAAAEVAGAGTEVAPVVAPDTTTSKPASTATTKGK